MRRQRPILVVPDGDHKVDGNYMAKILALHERGLLPASGLTELVVRHDDTCGIFSGWRCDCDPEIAPYSRPAPAGAAP